MADNKLKLGEYQKPNKDRTKTSIDNYVKGMREKKGGKALSPRNVRKIKLKDGGRIGRSLGGGTGLKDIPAGKKFNGLRKLPTEVRNKMKFKKKGGKV
jgi:hypothetical protein|tara:strand:+ start:231 stop:524 length:294 start_codon:yes stop_codon:yes gene_type:complete